MDLVEPKVGRSERIWTSGPYVPNVVLYQTELHSDGKRQNNSLLSLSKYVRDVVSSEEASIGMYLSTPIAA